MQEYDVAAVFLQQLFAAAVPPVLIVKIYTARNARPIVGYNDGKPRRPQLRSEPVGTEHDQSVQLFVKDFLDRLFRIGGADRHQMGDRGNKDYLFQDFGERTADVFIQMYIETVTDHDPDQGELFADGDHCAFRGVGERSDAAFADDIALGSQLFHRFADSRPADAEFFRKLLNRRDLCGFSVCTQNQIHHIAANPHVFRYSDVRHFCFTCVSICL